MVTVCLEFSNQMHVTKIERVKKNPRDETPRTSLDLTLTRSVCHGLTAERQRARKLARTTDGNDDLRERFTTSPDASLLSLLHSTSCTALNFSFSLSLWTISPFEKERKGFATAYTYTSVFSMRSGVRLCLNLNR